MYSRSTDKRRIKLPPGYDGSAFRHDTGEIRPPDEIRIPDTDMKIHSTPDVTYTPPPKKDIHPIPSVPQPVPDPYRENASSPEKTPSKTTGSSFLEEVLSGLGSEEWLLFLVVLLLLADGSDAWDIILLLCLLLAVHGEVLS